MDRLFSVANRLEWSDGDLRAEDCQVSIRRSATDPTRTQTHDARVSDVTIWADLIFSDRKIPDKIEAIWRVISLCASRTSRERRAHWLPLPC